MSRKSSRYTTTSEYNPNVPNMSPAEIEDQTQNFSCKFNYKLFNQRQYYFLKVCNCWAGIFHFVSFLTLIILASINHYFDDKYQIVVTSTKATKPFDAIQVDVLGKVPIVIFPIIFAAICFISHFAVEWDYYNSQTWYFEHVKNNTNPLRWREYFFSSSVMIIAISLIIGITDLQAILGNMAANMAMIWCGHLHEQANKRFSNTQSLEYYIWGCFFGLIPWIGILRIGFTAVASIPDEKVKLLVLNIVFSLFSLFMVFAAPPVWLYFKMKKKLEKTRERANTLGSVSYIQVVNNDTDLLMSKDKKESIIDSDYVWYEISYIVLSFVAKTLLTWLIFGVVFSIP